MGVLSISLVEAFTNVAKEHHDEFIEVGGEDPDWAKWYADRLVSPLEKILDRSFDSQKLAQTLSDLDKEYRNNNPQISWQEYYSNYFENQS
jgi:hypothetical protein